MRVARALLAKDWAVRVAGRLARGALHEIDTGVLAAFGAQIDTGRRLRVGRPGIRGAQPEGRVH